MHGRALEPVDVDELFSHCTVFFQEACDTQEVLDDAELEDFLSLASDWCPEAQQQQLSSLGGEEDSDTEAEEAGGSSLLEDGSHSEKVCLIFFDLRQFGDARVVKGELIWKGLLAQISCFKDALQMVQEVASGPGTDPWKNSLLSQGV